MVKMFCINILRLFPSLFFMFGIMGCSWLIPEDEEFSFSRTPFNGSEFRTDGYYYEMFSFESNKVVVEGVSIYFFNRNGTVLYGESPTTAELAKWEDDYKNGQYYLKCKNNKIYWGIFKVDGKRIIYESWSNPNGTYLAYRYFLKIINDTTIEFTSSEHVYGDEKKTLEGIYHFKPFSPKPDSVVSFIP